ncbi:hypothetical protein KAV79_07340, partial [Candidatus Aerophobetes bacterium]|nr:hypothetical protein [Candidatus Aerophobetes bacterium]
GKISKEEKERLEELYLSLNPAELKRKIDERTHELYQIYEKKKKKGEPSPFKKQIPRAPKIAVA